MNEPIRLRATGCRCDGSGLLSPTGPRCLCQEESADGAYMRVLGEKYELQRANDELSLLALDLERERDLLRARVEQLLGHRLTLLDALSERAAAMQQAGNIDGAKRLFAVVREVADG